MPLRILLPALILVVLFAGEVRVAPAAAAPPACATTTDPAAPSEPLPGAPCWTDVDPYPFGADGNPVDVNAVACRPPAPPGPNYAGDRASCYLKVDSLAFRAHNRGLAAASPVVGDLSSTTAYGVWLFNGARWFPDPTFPGQSVCRGNRVLWAGKRDYWLVGSRLNNWPSVCRFDGVNFEWQPLEVPRASLDRVPRNANGSLRPGAINAAACFRWDDCWLFGSYGVVVHWDGNVLADASGDLAGRPWLRGDYTAAVARTDTAGSPFGVAVTSSGGPKRGEQLPPRGDGSAPPQLFGSAGGPFAPLGFSPPTGAQPGDPYRTDLVAVDFDSQGRGWAAGNPVGYSILGGDGSDLPNTDERRVSTPQPAPLSRISTGGAAVPCPQVANRFAYGGRADGSDGFLWSSITVVPGAGDAVAGGQIRSGAALANPSPDGVTREPVLVRGACDAAPGVTRFRVPDPFLAGPPIPADRGGAIRDVAANAVNDAWAASTTGAVTKPGDLTQSFVQRPHVYRLTDLQPPLAPAGDDDEPRPLVFQSDPPIFVELPPDEEPPAAPDTTDTRAGATTRRTIRLKAAIYAVRIRLEKAPRGGTLSITFKVRRPITIGAQALRGRKVVSSTGLKRFRGARGRLLLKLDRRRWPTRIRFVSPGAPPRIDARLDQRPPEPGRRR